MVLSMQRFDKAILFTPLLKSNLSISLSIKTWGDLETAEGDFKKRFYNQRKSLNNESSADNTTLSKYIWELK